MEYIVIYNVNIIEFEREVTEYIKKGYTPIGGVSISCHIGTSYAQSLIKNTPTFSGLGKDNQ